MMAMAVTSLKCLAFSHDGHYLASVGKDAHNRESIVVWDITMIPRNEKPTIIAR